MEVVVQGVLLGGLYGLFALGLSLMFGVMRLTNIAHGDFIILCAFFALVLSGLGVPVALAILLTLPVAWAAGYAIQRFILNGTLGKDPLPSLVVTFGLAIVTQNFLQEMFSADPRSINSGGLSTLSLQLSENISVGVLPVFILLLAIACTAILQGIFNHTRLGRAFRAVSDDREVAELMGLNSRKIYALATAMAFVLISLAGAMQGMRTTVSPSDGPMLLLFAFEAVIIGGMGSFWGTLMGAILLGITQQIGSRLDPGWGIWAGHIMFLIVLVLRPQGLFPKTRD
ncbi:MAG TPA: branched-chain amino acid ABC transporter permease [Pusillimonas sp.]|uniref:branched-chain amino acid ABC transporter permease n=1 Tax=unclassified Pusillimonas TaxID=2640016 RepID=UPI0026110685|nr:MULTISPECIES: branched-chain amino acid ABC transporter permease [unclassified Pusillimonas]HLU19362.1 branched-chain amino acid ABC transporter permease [Pusillimonas sp.]